MIHQTSFVGIDVSKTHFDIHIHPAGTNFRCGVSWGEISQLVGRLGALGPVAVGVEASGGYESRLAEALHTAGLRVHILAPARVRSFARGIGQLAKTDRIDAAMIARHLMAVHAVLTPTRPIQRAAACMPSPRTAGGFWLKRADWSASSIRSRSRWSGTCSKTD